MLIGPNSLFQKFKKFYQRYIKSIRNGSFYRLSSRKRNLIINRLLKLNRQLQTAQIDWKSMSAGAMTIAALSISSPTVAQRAGDEFKVNTTTTKNQFRPATAMDGDGDFMITWIGEQTGSRIYAQRYNAEGVPQGGEFQVSTNTANSKSYLDIDANANGDYVAVWGSNGQDGDKWGVYAQRYNKSGVAQGSEFKVNTITTGNQLAPAVAVDEDGDFVVTYISQSHLYFQRFDHNGVAQGDEKLVSTGGSYGVNPPRVDMDDDGDFVIAWPSPYESIQFQRYTVAGEAEGSSITLSNSTNQGQLDYLDVLVKPAGDFILTWAQTGLDGNRDEYGIRAQRFNADGTKIDDGGVINTTTMGNQLAPKIAMYESGEYIITWEGGNDQDGSEGGIFAQRFDSNGDKIGLEYQVNTHTDGEQKYPDIAMISSGAHVITWQSEDQDGDGNGVYAQRFSGKASGATAPVISSIDDLSVVAVLKVSVLAQATDANWDQLSYTLDAESAKKGMTIDEHTGQFAWIPSINQIGTHTATITVSDGTLNDQVSFAVEVSAPDIWGREFQVNKTTLYEQEYPALASNQDGGFVIAWQTQTSNSVFGYRVHHRRYDAKGIPLGGETQLPNPSNRGRYNPAIAMHSDGSYLMTWQESFTFDDIFAQRYDAAGVAQGDNFKVNTETYLNQRNAAVAVSENGYVIAWESQHISANKYGIYAQRFNLLGEPQGGEFRVNTTTTGDQINAALANDAEGNFVITWQSDGQDGSGNGIYAQRYDKTGVAQGIEFLVNTETTGNQAHPSIGMDKDGAFVITWQSDGQDGDGAGIYAQRYDDAGVAQGSEFRVNTYTTLDQAMPNISMIPDGAFTIVWQSDKQDASSNGIFGQRFNADGTTIGEEFRINTESAQAQSLPVVHMRKTDDIVVAWQSDVQDGSQEGIYAKRIYNGVAPVITPIDDQSIRAGLTLSFTVSATDGNGDIIMFSLDDESIMKGMVIDAETGKFVWATERNHVGQHEVTVTADDGEVSTEYKFDITVTRTPSTSTAIEDISNLISLYPNPTTGAMTFSADETILGASYEIYNLMATVQASGVITAVDHSFDIAHLSNGIYLLKISIDGSTYTIRIIKND